MITLSPRLFSMVEKNRPPEFQVPDIVLKRILEILPEGEKERVTILNNTTDGPQVERYGAPYNKRGKGERLPLPLRFAWKATIKPPFKIVYAPIARAVLALKEQYETAESSLERQKWADEFDNHLTFSSLLVATAQRGDERFKKVFEEQVYESHARIVCVDLEEDVIACFENEQVNYLLPRILRDYHRDELPFV